MCYRRNQCFEGIRRRKGRDQKELQGCIVGGLTYEVAITDLMNVLEAENLIERLDYRKAASAAGSKKFIKMKGTRLQ